MSEFIYYIIISPNKKGRIPGLLTFSAQDRSALGGNFSLYIFLVRRSFSEGGNF